MNNEELQAENTELRLRLEEAEETIRAIQSGAVDAFVVQAPEGHRVYTLEGADRPYRLLVEQMQQGAATLRADGTMVYGNRQLAEMLGAPHEKLPGVLLQDFIAPDDRAVYDHLLEQGQTRSGRGEARLRRADGGLTPAFLTFNVLPKDCGAEVGVLVTDLTAQRHHEELEATYKRIDDLLTELRAADRRKDVFLAMLAHELRAPLAPLRNVLEILKRVGDPSELAQQARATMDRQLLHMTRLVDDLLDVSRISQGRIELKRERVELASIIYQALEACRPLAEGSKHQVSVALPPSAIHLHADPVRLVQVFGNLLNNACKYTEPGGRIEFVATLENRVAREPKDGDTALHHSPFTDRHVVVQVRDNGVGIPRDKLGGVFEMFAQIDHSLERAQGGLGIGLTLVKRLVELHGGNVTAHSEGPGRGSEFVVRLPILTDQPASGRPAAPTAAGRTAPQRVLVVDDNRDSALSLSMLLTMAGHQTQTTHDGCAAVETAAAFRPDVIFLDLGLPKMNGYDACRAIREQPWGKDIRIVAVTGWGQQEDRRKSAEAGFSGHLVKPVEYAALTKYLAGEPTEMPEPPVS